MANIRIYDFRTYGYIWIQDSRWIPIPVPIAITIATPISTNSISYWYCYIPTYDSVVRLWHHQLQRGENLTSNSSLNMSLMTKQKSFFTWLSLFSMIFSQTNEIVPNNIQRSSLSIAGQSLFFLVWQYISTSIKWTKKCSLKSFCTVCPLC